MNNVFSKTPNAWLAALALLPLSACSDLSESETAPESGAKTGVMFKIAGAPSQNGANESERLGEVNVYHFNPDGFMMSTLVEDPYAETVALPSQGTTKIYCLSGLDIDPKGMTQSQFASITTMSGKENAPMWYAGSADFNEVGVCGGVLPIEMKRSVARIDFSNSEDTGFVISQVIVEGAPAESFVFETDSVADFGTVSYTRNFAEPFYGTEEGMFQLFESQKPVYVRIIGQYKDSPLNIRTTLPTVERNKAYTLQMVVANSTVEGAFTIKDWEEGRAVSANPSAAGYYSIDKVNSIIPENVAVDYGRNILTVPHAGAKGIKVAFVSPEKISVASLEGEVPSVKITLNEAVETEGGYISSFNVDVEPNNRLTYKVIVNLRNESGKSDYVEIRVLENDSRAFETVEIAGRTWMAFNTLSADPADQIFPVDGLSVEEMYQRNWAMSVGNFFQYGRSMAFSPWVRNDPAANDSTPKDIPWVTPESMPVPPGYHVTTTSDWEALLPKGTTIPSTYTAPNGEQIKAELITLPGTLNSSPSASANKAGLLMRYLRFESQKTGNVLIIPICGMKTASKDEYPGGGKALHVWGGYWIAEDRYIWLFQVGGTADEPMASQGINRWNYNGFMAVRGVKNLD